MKRISVTLDRQDYERLVSLANGHDPPLSLRYVVEFAIKQILRRAENAQLTIDFGDPTRTEGEHE